MSVWKAIPDWDAYEVSEEGQVRRIGSAHPLRPWPSPLGYCYVSLSLDGVRFARTVQSLVMRTFVGEPAPGQVIRHRDGNLSNNAASNLFYATRGKA